MNPFVLILEPYSLGHLERVLIALEVDESSILNNPVPVSHVHNSICREYFANLVCHL